MPWTVLYRQKWCHSIPYSRCPFFPQRCQRQSDVVFCLHGGGKNCSGRKSSFIFLILYCLIISSLRERRDKSETELGGENEGRGKKEKPQQEQRQGNHSLNGYYSNRKAAGQNEGRSKSSAVFFRSRKGRVFHSAQPMGGRRKYKCLLAGEYCNYVGKEQGNPDDGACAEQPRCLSFVGNSIQCLDSILLSSLLKKYYVDNFVFSQRIQTNIS